ncbi:MAG: hypothetical protein ABSH51_13805 [Solirubrobacteraceae bacterium]
MDVCAAGVDERALPAAKVCPAQLFSLGLSLVTLPETTMIGLGPGWECQPVLRPGATLFWTT